MWRLFFLMISFNLYAGAGSCPLADGDIVFIKSKTEQSKLLRLTTDSEWTHVGMAFKRQGSWDIIEAVQPVRWTSLYSFVRRSHQLAFEVRRASFDFDPKAVKAAKEELGQLEKIGDLKNVDNPMIRAEAKRRFMSYGKDYNHEEWKQSQVITPIQMMNARNLQNVGDQRSSDDFADCLKADR